MENAFDCVEMKRKGAEYVRSLTKGMTREQLLAFWAKETEKLRAEQQALRDRERPGAADLKKSA